jgi:glycosyltransferase involved in cell wall biosynthesis
MRIAQVAPLFESVPPQLYGGTERVVSYLTEELVRQGHDVTLYASGDSKTAAHLVPACPMGLRLDSSCVDSVARHFAMIDDVYKSAMQFDVIHFHVDYLHFPWSSRELTPNVTTLHGRLDVPELPYVFHSFPNMPVVSISDAQRAPLRWLNWQGTVHHGMPVPKCRPPRGRGDYLAFIGRFSPEKGPIDAIEIARQSGMRIKMAAKIDRADREYFEANVKALLKEPFVEYIGEINDADRHEFMADAAAVLFPVNWPEPFGLVMIEAMSCGTPVIAYARGSVPEVVEHGVSGFVVENLAGAVQAVQNLKKIDRRSCFESFRRRFSVERMARQYVSIYQQLAGEPATEFLSSSEVAAD